MNLKRKSYLIEEDMVTKIDILRKHLNLLTEVNVVRNAINSLWKDTFKYGTDPILKPISNDTDDDKIAQKAERKVKSKLAEAKVKQDISEQPKIDICNQLDGEIITTEDGRKVCEYFVHSVNFDEKRKVPLAYLAEKHLNDQWLPNKKVILEARPEVALKFKV